MTLIHARYRLHVSTSRFITVLTAFRRNSMGWLLLLQSREYTLRSSIVLLLVFGKYQMVLWTSVGKSTGLCMYIIYIYTAVESFYNIRAMVGRRERKGIMNGRNNCACCLLQTSESYGIFAGVYKII